MTDFFNEISINLYSAASNMTDNGNLLLSPISIVYASMLVYLGSKGTTKTNFDFAFKLDGNASTNITMLPFTFYLSKLEFDISTQKQRAGIPETDFLAGEMHLKLVNSIFLHNNLNVSSDYLNSLARYLKASESRKNFATNPEGARKDINNWVDERTGGKIKDLIPEGGVDKRTKAVLVNALYFKAAWREAFSKSITKEEDFKSIDGSRKNVSFMHMTGDHFSYFDDSVREVQYLEIPYHSNEASLLIVLPKCDTGLRQVEATLYKDGFRRFENRALRNTFIDLSLPKFKVESSFDAKKLLQTIGVTEVFTNKADLTGIVPDGGVEIAHAFHKTFIDFNEDGTEAAAATTLKMIPMSAMIDPGNPIVFKADHPFVFAIRHNPTRLILFIGRVETL